VMRPPLARSPALAFALDNLSAHNACC
jgi:hypothetical protein